MKQIQYNRQTMNQVMSGDTGGRAAGHASTAAEGNGDDSGTSPAENDKKPEPESVVAFSLPT